MSIRVVIVDDAPFIREVLRHLLIKNGIDVVGEAVDGQQAIEVVQAASPDLVLMDMVMPKKSGIEATKEILALMPNLRIIAMSTTDQQSMVLRALDAGCCGYVSKPFQVAELLKAINSSLQDQTRSSDVR